MLTPVKCSAKEVMFYPTFVCLFVCLSVCLLAILRETTDRVFMRILPKTYLWARKNPNSGSFEGFFSIAR